MTCLFGCARGWTNSILSLSIRLTPNRSKLDLTSTQLPCGSKKGWYSKFILFIKLVDKLILFLLVKNYVQKHVQQSHT